MTRPLLITILCILQFLLSIFSIIVASLFNFGFLSSTSDSFPLWYTLLVVLMSFFTIAAIILIWKMKKIGLYSITVLIIIDFLVSIYLNDASIIVLIISIIVLFLFWSQYKKFD